MKKIYQLIILLFLILIIFNCSSDSENDNAIDLRNQNEFHSEELENILDQFLPHSQIAISSIKDIGYDHYLVLYRSKGISEIEGRFNKVGAISTSLNDKNISLTIGETEVASDINIDYTSYSFSNDFYFNQINGQVTDKLPPNKFNEISFELSVDETTFIGDFPEPSTLSSENTTINLELIYKSQGQELNWSPLSNSNNKIKLRLIHLSTQSGGNKLEDKILSLDDIGEFLLSPNILSDYSVGDLIMISLSRDVFISSSGLLVRGIEEQFWGPIELYN